MEEKETQTSEIVRDDAYYAYQSIQQRFGDVCNLIKGLILRYIRRYSARLLNDRGNQDPARTSAREVLHIAGVAQETSGDAWLTNCGFPTIVDIEEQLEGFRALIERRIEATYALEHAERMPPETIQAQFQLSEQELLLLCAIAAGQLNIDIARLYRFATGLDTTIFPAWFYADLISDNADDRAQILHLLEPEQPLCLFALVEVGQRTEWGVRTPVLQAPVSVPNRISAFLMGDISEGEIEYAHLWCPEDKSHTELILPESFKKAVHKQLRKMHARVGLYGADGWGRRAFIRECAALSGQNVLEIDMSALTTNETEGHLRMVAGLWFREARLKKATMIFDCSQNLNSDIQPLLTQVSPRILEMSQRHPGAICIIARTPAAWIRQLLGDHIEIFCPDPRRSEQPEFWRSALNGKLSDTQLEEAVQYVSTSYCLTPGEIVHVIDATIARLGGNKHITGESLSETLRLTRGRELEGLAELKPTPLGLNDIVLNADSRQMIDEILNFARYSELIRQDWGFARMHTGASLSVLFSGPPGTGKTLTAGVLAHELRRALYVVDISRVVDKYIGETEKRLAKIFDHAQQSQAILLFDEADSLFAKRTSVKSSNDRYANLEVNYLLQRLESYNGISILTTNLASSLDEALARRIQFKLEFPMPNEHERANLWQCLIPKQAPSESIDYLRLGESFEMSGGHIKNAVFRACIEAASLKIPLNTEILWNAGLHEYREMGHVIRE